MFSKLKKQFSSLKKGKPGKRFSEHYERRQSENKKAPAWKNAATVILAVALLIVAVAFSLLPGLPGFVLALPALGLLVTRSRRLAVWMDWAEVTLRHIVARIRPGGAKPSKAGRSK